MSRTGTAAPAVSARRVRASITVTAWMYVVLAVLTLAVAGGIATTRATALYPRLGAAAWYVLLGIVGAVLLAIIAGTLFRVRDADPPTAQKLKRTAVASYWSIIGLIAATAAGMGVAAPEGWIIMIPAFNALVLALSALYHLKERARGA